MFANHILYLSKHDNQNFEFVDLDTDKEIEVSDPKIWEPFCLLSRSQHLKEAYLKLPTHHHKATTPKISTFDLYMHSSFVFGIQASDTESASFNQHFVVQNSLLSAAKA